MVLRRKYSEMRPDDFKDENRHRWIAVLPLGAHEQHGPHLPSETDAIIAQSVADRLSESLSDDVPVTFLPVEPVGYSPEHLDLGDTISLTYSEAVERWVEIGAGLAQNGIRKLMLLNAHGGNSALMTIVATELRIRHAMLCVATGWNRFGVPGNLVSEEEIAYGIHGGDIETSVMLAVAPDQVDMTRAGSFHSFQKELADEDRYLRAYGRHAFGWKMSDLNPIGVTGRACDATAEKGEALLAHSVEQLATLLAEMDRFDVSRFDPAT